MDLQLFKRKKRATYVPQKMKEVKNYNEYTVIEMIEKINKVTKKLDDLAKEIEGNEKRLSQDKKELEKAKIIVNQYPGRIVRKDKELDQEQNEYYKEKDNLETMLRWLYEQRNKEEESEERKKNVSGTNEDGDYITISMSARTAYNGIIPFLEERGLLRRMNT